MDVQRNVRVGTWLFAIAAAVLISIALQFVGYQAAAAPFGPAVSSFVDLML
jgi:hypothetical protein